MSRSSRHVARDRITSSRLSRQLASGGVRHLFFAGYQKQPRHRAADDRRSQSNADRVLAIARIHLFLPLLPPSCPFSPRFSPVFLFSIFPTFAAPRLSRPFAFLRVVRAYEFDFTRFPSIGEHRKLFLEQPISPCPPSDLCLALPSRYLASRIPGSRSLSSSSLKSTP